MSPFRNLLPLLLAETCLRPFPFSCIPYPPQKVQTEKARFLVVLNRRAIAPLVTWGPAPRHRGARREVLLRGDWIPPRITTRGDRKRGSPRSNPTRRLKDEKSHVEETAPRSRRSDFSRLSIEEKDYDEKSFFFGRGEVSRGGIQSRSRITTRRQLLAV